MSNGLKRPGLDGNRDPGHRFEKTQTGGFHYFSIRLSLCQDLRNAAFYFCVSISFQAEFGARQEVRSHSAAKVSMYQAGS